MSVWISRVLNSPIKAQGMSNDIQIDLKIFDNKELIFECNVIEIRFFDEIISTLSVFEI